MSLRLRVGLIIGLLAFLLYKLLAPNYRGTAYEILRLDNYNETAQAKMVDTLADSIKQCCDAYDCKPADVMRAAMYLKAQMKARGQDWTTTFAANLLITMRADAPTVDAAAERYLQLDKSAQQN